MSKAKRRDARKHPVAGPQNSLAKPIQSTIESIPLPTMVNIPNPLDRQDLVVSKEEPIPHLELYKVFRDYTRREDDLINQRLGWNFAIQGFLFAAYSFSLQKLADIKLGLSQNTLVQQRVVDLQLGLVMRELHTSTIVIAWMGLLVSAFILMGVWSAALAIFEVERRWHAIKPRYKPDPMGWLKRMLMASGIRSQTNNEKVDSHGADPPGLPGLVGGGNPFAHAGGLLAPNLLPIIFIAAWAALLFSDR